MSKSELKRLCTQDPVGMAKRIAELEEKLKAFEWQPIETAPKDGTRILAYTNDGYKVPLISQCLWDDGWWPDTWESIDESLNLTHWMRLPPTPKP